MARKKRKKAPLKDRKANPNSKYWKGKADEAWADTIRGVGKCERCGRATALNAHHLISRTRLYFRHDLSNGVCLCAHCHSFDASFSPHIDSYGGEKFMAWLKYERPGQYQWYEENKHNKRPPDRTYKQAYEDLKGE